MAYGKNCLVIALITGWRWCQHQRQAAGWSLLLVMKSTSDTCLFQGRAALGFKWDYLPGDMIQAILPRLEFIRWVSAILQPAPFGLERPAAPCSHSIQASCANRVPQCGKDLESSFLLPCPEEKLLSCKCGFLGSWQTFSCCSNVLAG